MPALHYQEFLIGRHRKEFFLHPEAVSRTSLPLTALIDGHMKEAKERCALIEDIDPQTFARYGQYIYTGDYQAADHYVVLDADAIVENAHANAQSSTDDGLTVGSGNSGNGKIDLNPAEDVIAEPEDWGFASVSTRKSGKSKKGFKGTAHSAWAEAPPPSPPTIEEPLGRKQQRWARFSTMQYPIVHHEDISSPRANQEACEDYTEVFLSHARIYVFADRYAIEDLKRLALHRLHQTLVKFTLYSSRVSDITALLSFSYGNTPDRAGMVDELRSLVVKYVCCHINRVHADACFVDMMRAEGPLSVDLLRELMEFELN